MTMSAFDVAAATEVLQREFAPWVQELGLTIATIGRDGATLRMQAGSGALRSGGVVCGQALMTLADTAMVFAVAGASGGYRPMTTVGQTISFMKPARGATIRAEARVLLLGKTLAFGEIAIKDPAGEVVAHATTTYAMLGPIGEAPSG
jgi:uncharacterized protein (TIGR00369 family)